MRFMLKTFVVILLVGVLTGVAFCSESNWRIKLQADDGSDGEQGTAMHLGVYPTSSDGVDTIEPIQDQLPMYGLDMGKTTRWVDGVIEGSDETWVRNILSPASPAAYANDTKTWELRIGALQNSSDSPIRLRFYTLGLNYLPPSLLNNREVSYRLVMVNNRGVNGAPENGTTWTIPIPTTHTATAFYTLPVTLPVLRLSAATHEAMKNEGYILSFQQQLGQEIVVPPPPVTLSVTITTPTNQSFYETTSGTIDIGGTASEGVTSVDWVNNRGGSGQCTGTTTWSATGIVLAAGQNRITVTAHDGSGNTATDVLTVTYTVPVEDTGVTWKGLVMLSLPIIPSSTDPKFVIDFDGNSWFRYMTDLRRYVGYGNDPDHLTWFEPVESVLGRGYWARFTKEVHVPTGDEPDQTEAKVIHLLPGWNLIGQPFLTPVPWNTSEIMVQEPGKPPVPLRDAADVAVNYVWGWRQNKGNPFVGNYYLVYDPAIKSGFAEELSPWEGYWLLAYKECDLIIPPP